ncbi:MAG: phosphoribosylanthranilate isomerase, partial [Gammaproteobacteria bacterium]
GNPVAVVVDQTADEIKHICSAIGVNIVQLHGTIAKQQEYLLPRYLQRIYVCSVNYDGTVVDSVSEHLEVERDFLLFDGINAGSGQTFNWQNFVPQTKFRWFLSGGLSPNNVIDAVKCLHPYAVDVSSGVENSNGSKDKQLIHNFINKAKNL